MMSKHRHQSNFAPPAARQLNGWFRGVPALVVCTGLRASFCQQSRDRKNPAPEGGIGHGAGELSVLLLARKIGRVKIFTNNTPTPFA